jgi:hypothetical protein
LPIVENLDSGHRTVRHVLAGENLHDQGDHG